MINACNDCGNAIEECDCEPLHEDLDFAGQGVRAPEVVAGCGRGCEACAASPESAPHFTESQANAIGKATYEAYMGTADVFAWREVDPATKALWIAAGIAARAVAL